MFYKSRGKKGNVVSERFPFAIMCEMSNYSVLTIPVFTNIEIKPPDREHTN